MEPSMNIDGDRALSSWGRSALTRFNGAVDEHRRRLRSELTLCNGSWLLQWSRR